MIQFSSLPTYQKTTDQSFGVIFLSLLTLVNSFIFDSWPGSQMIALICCLFSAGITCFRYFKDDFFWLRPASYGLLFLSFFLAGFPLDTENPFNFFRYPLFQNLFVFLPSLFAARVVDCKNSPTELDRMNYWIPVVFLVAINSFFAIFDYRDLLPFDSSRHLANALSVYHSLKGESGIKLWEVFMYYDFYQPVAYILPGPFFLIFGKSNTSAVLGQCLFWLPLAYTGIFRTLRYLRFGSGIAALVGFISLGGTLSFSLLRHFMQDFPVLCVLIWFQFYLLKSGFLKHKKSTFVAGLLFGIGILTKASFLFLLPGFVVLVGASVVQRSAYKQMLGRIDNLFYFVIPIVLTAGFWFMVNQSHYNYTLPTMKNFAEINHLANAEELKSKFWYVKRLPEMGGILLLVVFIVGSALSVFVRKRIQWPEIYGMISFFASLALVSVIPNKDLRTIFPLIGFMVIPAAFFFRVIKPVFSLPLISGIILWFFIIDYTQTLNWNWAFGSSLKPQPFIVSSAPEAPDTQTPNLSYFTYEKQMRACFSDSLIPRLVFGENDNYHSRKAFSYLIPAPEVVSQALIPNSENSRLLFTRNKYWQDHYLWKLEFKDSMLVVSNPAKENQITGDYLIELIWLDADEHALKSENISVNPGPENWKFPVYSGAKKIRYGFKVHHTAPNGQWVQFVYDVLKRPDYHTFQIPLLIFNSDGPPVETQVMTIPGGS